MKKLLIYGMGTGAKNFVKAIDNTKFIINGITDSFVVKDQINKNFFTSIPIYLFEKWISLESDYIILCVPVEFEITIKNKISFMGIHKSKIYTVLEFYKMIYYSNYENKHNNMMKNNQLYNFFMEGNHTKISKWFHYFDIYETFFKNYKNKNIVMCEVGVCKGGSTQMWKNYFGSNATIIGIDINEECKQYEYDNIKIEIGSQDNPEFWKYIKEKYPKIDLFLDDGGHTMQQQIITFENMFSHISDEGIYICEDCHTSYWEEFGGGYKTNSFLEYTKNFVDEINAYHSHNDALNVNYNTRHMIGLHYYDSMVIIEKGNVLPPFSISK